MASRILLLLLLIEGLAFVSFGMISEQFQRQTLWTKSLELFAVPGTLFVLSFSKGRWPGALNIAWAVWISLTGLLIIASDSVGPSHYSGITFVALVTTTAVGILITNLKTILEKPKAGDAKESAPAPNTPQEDAPTSLQSEEQDPKPETDPSSEEQVSPEPPPEEKV